MAPISRPHDTAAGRSGGKILRERRTAAPRTPYDRSHLLSDSAPQNPNWLSKLIFSPSRMIATGAGKFLSVFRSESSSSSSSDDDSTSEGDSDDANDDICVPSKDANELEKLDSLGKDPQALEWKSETKRAIERLLMQETFSREECDRLTHIIMSRVVDSPLTGGIEGRLDVDMPDLCSAAMTEAKKWLEEKKLGPNSKPTLEYGTCNLNTTVSPYVMEGEIGSPVDLAKSYMRKRPPWSSPSMKDSQLKSPSLGTQIFKEDTPYLYRGNSIFTSKIRDSPSTGSWNITQEIRKVRSKATEDMLRTRPLLMTEISMVASDNIRCPGSLVSDKTESVSQIAQDRLLNEASPLDPSTSISQQSQDLVAIQITEGVEALRDSFEGGLSHIERRQHLEDMKAGTHNGHTAASADGPKDTGGTGQPLSSAVEEDTRDSRSREINDSTLVEVTVVDGEVSANGFTPPKSSLHTGQGREEKSKSSSGQNKLAESGHGNNKDANASVDEIYEHLGELDVPNINENDGEAAVSENSSSMQHEEVMEEEIIPPNLKHKVGKSNDTTATEKQQGGRRRYARKGKGRLK